MNLEPIVCSQCGAPLQIPAEVGFAMCNHCHTALAVRRGADVTYTERLDTLEGRTETLAEQLAELRYSEALNDLEQDWKRERSTLAGRRLDGTDAVPNIRETWWSWVVFSSIIVMGTLGYYVIVRKAIYIPIIGAAIVLLSLYAVRAIVDQAKRYHEAEARYLQRRSELRQEHFPNK